MTAAAKERSTQQRSTQRRIDHALGEARRHAIKEDNPVVWALIAVAEEIRALRLTLRAEIRAASFDEEEGSTDDVS